MTETVDIQGLEEVRQQMERLLSDKPAMRSRLQAVVRRVLQGARSRLSADARTVLGSDPRKAYKAVRSAVYRRLLGGQLNILQRRRAGSPTAYEKPRKGLPLRGGNRWGRSERTMQVEGYQGADRGFILRFLNSGTASRRIHSYTAPGGSRHDLRTDSGNRGSIAARGWFAPASQRELESAAAQLQRLIDELIDEEFNTL